MTWYRNRITNRLREAEQPLPYHDLTEHGGQWTAVTDEEAAGDVRYVRNKAGAVHSLPLADLAAALAAGGTELTVEEARAADPRLFGEADPAVRAVSGVSRFRENRGDLRGASDVAGAGA